MKTAEEIISYLEEELEEKYRQVKLWKDKDRSEAMKYQIQAYELEHLLEELDPTEPERIARILVSMPEEKKPKKSKLDIYFDVFAVVAVLASWWTIDDLIYRLVDMFPVLKGPLSGMLHYGYMLVHFISFVFLVRREKKK